MPESPVNKLLDSVLRLKLANSDTLENVRKELADTDSLDEDGVAKRLDADQVL